MPKISPIQQSFAAGEISPRMSARSDLKGYHEGCRKLENFLPLPQGPIRRRGGLSLQEIIPQPYGRIFDFSVSLYVGYVVTITPNMVYVSDNHGQAATPDLLENGDFIFGGLGWTDVSVGSGVVVYFPGICRLSPGLLATHIAAIRQEAEDVVEGEDHLVTVKVAAGSGPLLVNIGSTAGGDNLFSGSFTTTAKIEIPIAGGTHTSIWVDIIVEGGNDTKDVDQVMVQQVGNEGVIEFPSPWSSPADILLIQKAMPPGEFSMYFTSPTVPMQQLSYNLTTRTWTLEEVVFVDPPAEWTSNNYPRAIAFHQNRLCLGGTLLQPEKLWLSTTDDYKVFTIGTEDDDSIHTGLTRKGAIQWMEGAKNLLVGTGNAEWLIMSGGSVLTPGDHHSEQQSAFGSAPIQAEEVGNKVVYISPDGKKMRIMGYKDDEQGWVTQDLTFASEHITKGNRILETEYSQNPSSIIWSVTSGGNMLGCSIVTIGESVSVGWHRHSTYGRIISICVLEYGGLDDLWMLVDRDSTGTSLCLERVSYTTYLDSYSVIVHDPPATAISAVHLANLTVQVIADGAIVADVTLDASGNGNLENPASLIEFGLGYSSEFESMPVEKGEISGSAMSMMKRWNKIWVRLLESAKPLIYTVMPPTRHAPTLMDTAEPLATEDVMVTNLGWDRNGTLHIIQSQPLPCKVAGIFGEMAQHKVGS